MIARFARAAALSVLACTPGLVATPTLGSSFAYSSLVTPYFIRASETDTIFRNPAELTLHNRIVEARLSYGITNSRFGGLALLHIPDGVEFAGPNNTPVRNGIGDFALSGELFGSNLAQNLVFQNDSDGNGRFNLLDGGYKILLTYAKKTQFVTVGANAKYYYYRDLNTAGSGRRALGFDLGAFLTPLDDMFLGLSVNDVGNTVLRDNNNQPVLNPDGSQQTVAQVVRFTAAAVSGSDMSLSVGLPLSLIDDIQKNPRDGWKRVSFQFTKIFSKSLEFSAGSNTKDLYAYVGLHANDYLNYGITAARSIYDANDYSFTLALNIGVGAENPKPTPKPAPTPAPAVSRTPWPSWMKRPGCRTALPLPASTSRSVG
ncbi:hypothetical protein EBR96_05535 [bacterium]|nr:hypothetical protein [bacterium]